MGRLMGLEAIIGFGSWFGPTWMGSACYLDGLLFRRGRGNNIDPNYGQTVTSQFQIQVLTARLVRLNIIKRK